MQKAACTICGQGIYDPTIGRFISEDSYKGEITNPLSLNYYIYCENNPLIYIDPDGHECGAINIPDKNYNISIREWADAGLTVITFMSGGGIVKGGAKVTQVIVKGSITRKAANKIISLGSKSGTGVVKRVLGNSRIVRTGKVVDNVVPIGGKITGYTKHGLNQAIGRDGGKGVASKAILDTVRHPIKVVAQEGKYGITYKYVGKDAVVVLNEAGKVVTTYAKGSAGLRGVK